MFRLLGFLQWAVLGGICITSARGDEPRVAITPREAAAVGPRSNLRMDVKVVLVPVSVTDAMDRPVHTLSRNNFRVLEDGIEQKITSFLQDEAPVSLGLLFDSSGSMKYRIHTSIESLKLLFQTTAPGDEFFLVQFSDRAHLLGEFTPEPAEIYERLGQVRANGWTALLDAIVMGTHQMRKAKNRSRVLLILSDGDDNNSRYSESEVRNMVMEGDVRVYGIGIKYRPRLLKRLAEETGGDVLLVQNLSELPDVVQRLSREIRSQYLLGYSSTNLHNDGKYRKVRVELMPPPGAPPLHTSWRRGYYAPAD